MSHCSREVGGNRLLLSRSVWQGGEMEAEGCVDPAVSRSTVSEEPAPPEPVVAVADASGDGQAGVAPEVPAQTDEEQPGAESPAPVELPIQISWNPDLSGADRGIEGIYDGDLFGRLDQLMDEVLDGGHSPYDPGVFAQIFGGEDIPMWPSEESLAPIPAAMPFSVVPEEVGHGLEVDPQMRQAATGKPIFAKHVRALSDRDHAASQDLLWTRALASWRGGARGHRNAMQDCGCCRSTTGWPLSGT
eukprot:s227_g11.t1